MHTSVVLIQASLIFSILMTQQLVLKKIISGAQTVSEK